MFQLKCFTNLINVIPLDLVLCWQVVPKHCVPLSFVYRVYVEDLACCVDNLTVKPMVVIVGEQFFYPPGGGWDFARLSSCNMSIDSKKNESKHTTLWYATSDPAVWRIIIHMNKLEAVGQIGFKPAQCCSFGLHSIVKLHWENIVIVSKAAQRSNKTRTETSPRESKRISLVTFTSAVQMLSWALKPDWNSSKKLLLFKCSQTWSVTMFKDFR